MYWTTPSCCIACAALVATTLAGSAPRAAAQFEDVTEAPLLSAVEVEAALVERLHALEDRQTLRDQADMRQTQELPAVLSIDAPAGSDAPVALPLDGPDPVAGKDGR